MAVRILLPLLAIAAAAAFTPESRAESSATPSLDSEAVRKIVREYLLEHPEVIKEAIQVLQAKRASREQDRARTALREHDKALRSHPMSPVSGNPKGDVTLVEFFDYQCGCCKQSLKPVKDLLETDRQLHPVVRGTREGKLWNEFVARYHYLGYKTLVGAQMRYAVQDRNGWPLAMLGFSTAAWKLATRDTFIGWTRQLREKNLPFVVDNPRFLILPWIKIPNLGSHILALIRRRLPDDWTERYNTTPVLIETFVETPRYTGAVYRASGWIHVGATQGRGRYDRDRQFDKPKKDVWLRPLRRD